MSVQVANLEKWHPAQHVVTESLSGAIVTQKIVCHGPSHPKLPQPSPGKHTGVAEFIFNGELTLTAGLSLQACAMRQVQDLAAGEHAQRCIYTSLMVSVNHQSTGHHHGARKMLRRDQVRG